MPADAGALQKLRILNQFFFKDLAFGDTANAFFQSLAKAAPPGHYPRGMSGQQNYWTVIGVEGGRETALISEDGALEVARAGFTLEPFVVDAGKLLTWADVKVSQSLQENYLPIPSVDWAGPGFQLRTTAFARGTAAQSQLLARYQAAIGEGATSLAAFGGALLDLLLPPRCPACGEDPAPPSPFCALCDGAVEPAPEGETHKYGIVALDGQEGRLNRMTGMVEKPPREKAPMMKSSCPPVPEMSALTRSQILMNSKRKLKIANKAAKMAIHASPAFAT